MVVHNVGVGAHRHNRRLNFDLMENVLFRDLHHSYCPTLIAVFTIECLVHCAHCSFAQLFGKSVGFIRVFWLELNLGDLLVEFGIRKQGIVRNFLLPLKTCHDLNHGLWVFLNVVPREIVFLKKLQHVVCEPLDAHRTVQVDLQMQFVLEVGGPELNGAYLLI